MWVEGASITSTPDSFSAPITIATVNWTQRTAQLVGSIGVANLVIVDGNDVKTFVERTENGGINLYAHYRTSDGDVVFSTLARSLNFLGAPAVSTFVGAC